MGLTQSSEPAKTIEETDEKMELGVAPLAAYPVSIDNFTEQDFDERDCFRRLMVDVWCEVVARCTLRDICCLRRVSRRWRMCCDKYMPPLNTLTATAYSCTYASNLGEGLEPMITFFRNAFPYGGVLVKKACFEPLGTLSQRLWNRLVKRGEIALLSEAILSLYFSKRIEACSLEGRTLNVWICEDKACRSWNFLQNAFCVGCGKPRYPQQWMCQKCAVPLMSCFSETGDVCCSSCNLYCEDERAAFVDYNLDPQRRYCCGTELKAVKCPTCKCYSPDCVSKEELWRNVMENAWCAVDDYLVQRYMKGALSNCSAFEEDCVMFCPRGIGMDIDVLVAAFSKDNILHLLWISICTD